jgi:hypothetical protein
MEIGREGALGSGIMTAMVHHPIRIGRQGRPDGV